MFYGYYGGNYFVLFILVAILSMWAQGNVSSTFNKYSKVANRKGYTGADVARMLLNSANIYDVSVEPIRGNLTDHYDPKGKVIRLSESVFNSRSVAALGVAAHETGHAIQHNVGYLPLTIRSSIFPIVNFSSRLAMPLIMIGFLFSALSGNLAIVQFGIILFSIVVLFQLVTLPVEFNASTRALNMLGDEGYLSDDELQPTKKVLKAAAMTYVAAAAVSIVQLLRLIAIFGNRRD